MYVCIYAYGAFAPEGRPGSSHGRKKTAASGKLISRVRGVDVCIRESFHPPRCIYHVRAYLANYNVCIREARGRISFSMEIEHVGVACDVSASRALVFRLILYTHILSAGSGVVPLLYLALYVMRRRCNKEISVDKCHTCVYRGQYTRGREKKLSLDSGWEYKRFAAG